MKHLSEALPTRKPLGSWKVSQRTNAIVAETTLTMYSVEGLLLTDNVLGSFTVRVVVPSKTDKLTWNKVRKLDVFAYGVVGKASLQEDWYNGWEAEIVDKLVYKLSDYYEELGYRKAQELGLAL